MGDEDRCMEKVRTKDDQWLSLGWVYGAGLDTHSLRTHSRESLVTHSE
jgi:hypothetical protein